MLLRGKKIVSDQMIKNMISNNGFQNLIPTTEVDVIG